MRARGYAVYGIATAVVFASIAMACSLNPQPIPPGDEPDGSGGGANAATPNTGDSVDGSTSQSVDGGHMNDGAIESGPIPPKEDGGGDASDASDDASDAAHD